MISRGSLVVGVLAWMGSVAVALPSRSETLWLAKPFSSEGFTGGIEGPACDRNGVLFCVGFGDPRNIARVTPDGRAERFVTLPEEVPAMASASIVRVGCMSPTTPLTKFTGSTQPHGELFSGSMRLG